MAHLLVQSLLAIGPFKTIHMNSIVLLDCIVSGSSCCFHLQFALLCFAYMNIHLSLSLYIYIYIYIYISVEAFSRAHYLVDQIHFKQCRQQLLNCE